MKINTTPEKKQLLMLVAFILIGTIGRYVLVGQGIQPFPNFEIIMVLTFLASLFISPILALIVPITSMVLSDLLIGNPIFVGSQMNRIVLFTYSGFALIGLLSILIKNKTKPQLTSIKLKSIGLAAGLGIGFVLLYDIWTNLGWWYLMYPHTASSLGLVFTAGIPFMINHMLSGILTFVFIALPVTVYLSQKISITVPLRLRNIHKIPLLAVVSILIALSFTGTANFVPEKTEIWLEQAEQTSVSIRVQTDSWSITDNFVAYPDDTAFTILQRAASKHNFIIESTYYPQFDSVLIDSINDIKNGENSKYWQYYVNDELPMIGADQFTIINGDKLLWSFEGVPS